MTKFEEFRQVIARLREPDGYPWDRKQTHASLKKTCIEEIRFQRQIIFR